MVAEKTRWLELAECAGATHLYYEGVWPDGEDEPLDAAALDACRSTCDECPVRRRCLDLVMTQERGYASQNRYGVAAGLTPAQRWSLEKRAALNCEKCGRTLDPTRLRAGNYDCECGARRTVAPIPDNGDRWSRRHTTLARRALAYLVADSDAGVTLPNPKPLSDEWGVHKGDMMRVYRELQADGLIERNETDTEWVVAVAAVPAREWQPLHLR